ncbi:Rrf2 family transcriptional regulator [Candidatus Sumerlaeota bacterium]|nr:Rrf2 family transcriptional regulator [Candidatus Sumerlaeota bacterium]
MLTQTSELAVKTLVFLGLEGNEIPLPPRQIADKLKCSASYLAKILGILVRSGILRSVRGARGGVLLSRDPKDVTLLDVVEACQGLLIGNYCSDVAGHEEPVCAFHTAMKEIHEVTITTLSKWTLADLLAAPVPYYVADENAPLSCKMAFVGCEKHAPKKNAAKTPRKK